MCASLTGFGSFARSRDVPFEERVAAQRVLERLYYTHQLAATRPFDEAVPRPLLEAKVRETLAQSAALATLWNSPIDAAALRNELTRIARDTRFPDRLREIYAGLGSDSITLQECFARRTLADRRSRELFAYDRRIHAPRRAEAESLRSRLESGELSLSSEDAHRTLVEIRRVAQGGETPEAGTARAVFRDEGHLDLLLDDEAYSSWRAGAPATVGEIGPILEQPDRFLIRAVLQEEPDRVLVASYLIPKRAWHEWWQEVSPLLENQPLPAVAIAAPLPQPSSDGGAALTGSAPSTCAATDAWDNGSLGTVPDGREGATAVWTGSEMIVWGGARDGRYLATGGRYDPATDTWRSITLLNAPAGRAEHTAVWSGTVMIVWGGTGGAAALGTGGRYNPATDEWTATSATNAPQARQGHVAVQTATRMIVWAGEYSDIMGSHFLDTGGAYDPVANSWSPTATTGAPQGRSHATAVWTGDRMIVWGGRISSSGGLVDTGGLYKPADNSWTPMPTALAPSPREYHSAVWAGDQMIVWGGHDYVAGSPRWLGTGARYRPSTSSWYSMTAAGAPQPRRRHTAAWARETMVVWGGDASGASLGNGARYNPENDTWLPVSPSGAPQGRTSHIAVWTGNVMIVWGGGAGGNALLSGGRYNPFLDSWTATYAPSSPPPRESPSSVWTGNVWIVWGGLDGEDPLNTGGRYDPLTDTWSPTTLLGATRVRVYHTAVWSGDRMIVWGGEPCPFVQDRGGSYDPVSDTWQPIDFTTEPLPRRHHTAIWTGSRMVVWGGLTCETATSVTNTGALYNPMTNSWSATSTSLAPTARKEHSVVWTGSRMIVWGGADGNPLSPTFYNTGARYDPGANSWTIMSPSGAPARRRRHTAVWTGSSMIVWGGTGASDFNTGGRYDDAANQWTATSTTGAPSARFAHSAVWTGSIMVVWGGETIATGLDALGTGGRYNPATNTWVGVSLQKAPSPRRDHASVWVSPFVIIWGGTGEYTLDSGGRYVVANPDGDLDGVADVCDCAPANPAVFAVPGEIGGFAMAPDKTTINWVSATASSGSGTVHDVMKGSLAALPVGGGSGEMCFSPGISTPMTQDPATPGAATGWWYIVRGRNACGTGTYGWDSAGSERQTTACP